MFRRVKKRYPGSQEEKMTVRPGFVQKTGLAEEKICSGPVLQLFRGLFAVIPGRHAESFFESAVKVRQILVADFLRDGKNRGFGGDQQAGSHGQAVFIEIFDEGSAHRILEILHEMRLAQPDLRRDICNCNALHIMVLQIF